MRNEIKIPVNKDFNLYFDHWKDFQNKISRTYKDRLINSIYYDDENFTTAQNNLSGISNRRKYRIRWYYHKYEKNTEIQFDLNYIHVYQLMEPHYHLI